jgi:phosphoribosylanthranilate isomerase
MQVKICGMREAVNLGDIANLSPDYLGFIFYEKSPRYVGDALDAELLRSLPPTVRKVGVFVDAPLPQLVDIATRYGLDYVQLHGHESAAYCREAHAQGLRLIKAFSVDAQFDFGILTEYGAVCDFFLFDTKGKQPGGNGYAFDWGLLAGYNGPAPFLLSGGLGPENATELLSFTHPYLAGYDFNSQLETAPGLKDVVATRELLLLLNQQVANS